MMRSVLLGLMFSGSVFALSSTAYAQTSPDTRQTDQSEEDWRKSKKKGGTSAEDIIDIIENTRGSGVGNGRGYSPIDALPEESRRHLMKERARRMAQAGPNEPVDVTYKPSEAAKSDSDLQDDEKAAWEKMAQGMNGAPDQGLSGQQGQGQQGQQGQGQSGQQGGGAQGQQGSQGQQGQQQGGSQSSGQSGQSRSVMRGGSAASVSDIMARIKGLTPGGGVTGQAPQGQPGQGQQDQGQQGQGSQGQQAGQSQSSPGQSGQRQNQQNQGSQGQSQQQAQNQGQQQGQSQSQSQQNGQQQSNSQAQAQAEAKAKAQAQADAASKAHSIAHAPDASQASSSTRKPEAISPLDRIKTVNQERNNFGSRSSAADYLKKKQ